MAARPRVSAGILLYRIGASGLEVLLGHPGGPYFARKDEGHWSVPKGEVEVGEGESDADLLAVALREFEEETGSMVMVAPASLFALGEIVQKGGKRVVAWAAAGDLDPATAHSNTFALEWPPGSGRFVDVPEIDRVAWFTPGEARRSIKSTQIPLIDRLEAALSERTPALG